MYVYWFLTKLVVIRSPLNHRDGGSPFVVYPLCFFIVFVLTLYVRDLFLYLNPENVPYCGQKRTFVAISMR